MPFDPHALKIYVDGSCSKNPGGRGGFAVWLEFPFDLNRPDELLDYCGYFETNNNRMELRACIFAHEWIRGEGTALRVQRVQIVTDSKYVFDNYNRAVEWSRNGWRNSHGRPLDNKDLWKQLLSTRRSLRIRVDVEWTSGKKSPILRAVDRSAKMAASMPSRVDWGFGSGKIGRSRNSNGQPARMFPAAGQRVVTRIYQTVLVRRDLQKVKFQTYSNSRDDFFEKFVAYADSRIGNELHRHHLYLVRFNDVTAYPRIEEILSEVESNDHDSIKAGAA